MAKTFKEFAEACWDSHKQVGFKMKGGKRVPNCVPKNEEGKDIPLSLYDLSELGPAAMARRKNRFTKDRFIWSFNRGSIGVTRMGHRTFTVHRLSI